MINLMLHTKQESWDISGLVTTIAWSGNYQSCARRLEFELLANGPDALVPEIPCDLGSRVVFQADGNAAFDGFVFSRQKATESSCISVTCYDRGLYLKRNEKQYQFVSQTPEAIAKRVCADFGILVGNLAQTGVAVSRNFTGDNLYRIIMTAYTLAAEQTGASYFCIFRGERLCVEERKRNGDTLLLAGGSNLMRVSCSESVENLVNRVEIYDSQGNYRKAVEDKALIARYGVLQKVMKQPAKSDDVTLKAQKALQDNGYCQNITLENLGDARCVTGGTVAVQEPYTGVCGFFWIDNDTHSWKNGLYFNKLVLNFKSIMDAQEAGSLPTAGKTAAGDDGEKAHYVNKPAAASGS